MEGESKSNLLWKKLPLKYKLIVIGVISGFVSIILFLVVMITPLMELGIIDIEGISDVGIGYSSNTYFKKIYNECSSVVVDGKAWKLEEYVAGVVSAEAYNNESIEALKAQAIAARTYAIAVTNNCQKAIDNSSYAQNFTSNFNERAVEASKSTEGLVLTYDSKIFTTMYDSFYRGGDYSCDLDGCYVTYTRLPNNEKHTVSISSSRKNQAAGGHGYGMSQVASYDLADQGYKFDYILKYFYSPGVQISSLKGSSGYTKGVSASSANFVSRTNMPISGNYNDDKYFFSNENLSYQGGYVGQCTWYAFGRANEILDRAGSDLSWNYAPDAKYWLQYNIDSGANAFSYSTDVTEPQVGAIIVWGSSAFGHVAIVEKVNPDGTIDYSEANISSAKSTTNKYGFRYQSHVSYADTGVGTISNIWNGYEFLGYIYMVE